MRSVPIRNADCADAQSPRLAVKDGFRREGDEAGFMLMELVIAMGLLMVILVATFYSLDSTTRTQTRFQSYAQEITTTQGALAHLVHDLREATQVVFVTPDKLEFNVPLKVHGVTTTWTVLYDCTARDSLGSAYTRCARTQSSTGTPPAAGATAGSEDIQHVWNNATRYSTFCNAAGTAPSGAVFFVSSSNIPDTDGSNAACDEAYETQLGLLMNGPQYVKIEVDVPARGNLTSGGLAHRTVLSTAVFLLNRSAGA